MSKMCKLKRKKKKVSSNAWSVCDKISIYYVCECVFDTNCVCYFLFFLVIILFGECVHVQYKYNTTLYNNIIRVC